VLNIRLASRHILMGVIATSLGSVWYAATRKSVANDSLWSVRTLQNWASEFRPDPSALEMAQLVASSNFLYDLENDTIVSLNDRNDHHKSQSSLAKILILKGDTTNAYVCLNTQQMRFVERSVEAKQQHSG
jgi:hypothetical protein